jgi:hypothetical protein
LGIRVSFETHRDYWIDHVVVTTTAIPEPASGVLFMMALGYIRCGVRGRSRFNGR